MSKNRIEEIYVIRTSKPKKSGFEIFMKVLFWILCFPLMIMYEIIKACFRQPKREYSEAQYDRHKQREELRALDSYEAKLETLASLRDKGIIDEYEFAQRKKELLDKL